MLAHPGRLKDRILIDEFASAACEGSRFSIRCTTPEDTREFRETARRYGLVMTAGMDFHDIRYHTKGVGMDVDAQDLAPFFDLIGAIA